MCARFWDSKISFDGRPIRPEEMKNLNICSKTSTPGKKFLVWGIRFESFYTNEPTETCQIKVMDPTQETRTFKSYWYCEGIQISKNDVLKCDRQGAPAPLGIGISLAPEENCFSDEAQNTLETVFQGTRNPENSAGE